ncbi:MAG TPA: stage II sporulation protein M [Burkholderiaceae bacterium]|nr:stage II sporulation protein M [Burkholderiaceae bacterium]
MTPVRFEAEYGALWRELEAALDEMERIRPRTSPYDRGAGAVSRPPEAIGPARLAALYRRCCEHLSLAQARAYPIGLIQRLQDLTYRAHRLIYRRRDYGAARLKRLVLVEIPQSVRAHRIYLLVAALLFVVPTLLVGVTTYRDPQFALHVLDPAHLAWFKSMYADHAGHTRSPEADWSMFGYYVMHNIGLGFQCFAGGIFAGVGSAFFLAYNGVFNGAVAGYLTEDGEAINFYSFIVTHSAFELTAIVLAGAAGLRIGHEWVAPGRRSRIDSVRRAAIEAVVLVYAVFGLLLVAAAIEAFWSSAQWVAPSVKLAVGAAAWGAVVAYLGWQGRPRSHLSVPADRPPHEG